MIPESVLQQVGERLEGLVRRCAAAAKRSKRDAGEVRLLAVTKRQPVERIAAAVANGALDLGENYVQEMRDKRPAVEALLREAGAEMPRWHLIGPLQRNKAALAVEHFDTVETLASERLAKALDQRALAANRTLDVLLQVNISQEAQKAGVLPDALPSLLAHCAGLSNLRVRGLMALPRADDDPEESRAPFAQLRQLRDTLRGAPGGESLEELSMGMSRDFEVAIEEGATRVRVGTALFGERAAATRSASGPSETEISQ